MTSKKDAEKEFHKNPSSSKVTIFIGKNRFEAEGDPMAVKDAAIKFMNFAFDLLRNSAGTMQQVVDAYQQAAKKLQELQDKEADNGGPEVK